MAVLPGPIWLEKLLQSSGHCNSERFDVLLKDTLTECLAAADHLYMLLDFI